MSDYTELGFDSLLDRSVDLTGSGFEAGAVYNPVTSSVTTGSIESGEYSGNLILSRDAHIRGGATDYNAGIGFWLGDDDGTKKFFVGNSSGNKMTWDGTTLSVTGSFIAGDLHVPDEDTTTNSWHVDTTGNMWIGATTTDFTDDNDNAEAFILATGVAKFQSVTLDTSVILSGLQAGSSLDAQYLTGTFGALTVGGALTISTSGTIGSGQTAYNTGTGYWLEYNAGTPRLSIGVSSGNYLTWSGTALTIKGTIIATTAEILGTTTDSFTINTDQDDANIDLVLDRTTGGAATMRWDGSTVNLDKTLTIGGVGIVLDTRQVISGAGLTGGGDLSADRTLAVGAGSGLTVNANDVALTTPGTLTVTSTNVATGSHTHAITSSSDPGAAASILASDASGILHLEEFHTDSLKDEGGANIIIEPTGDITLDPGGNDVLPNTNYDINLGAINKKYLTLHAAELWVETLVAQDTIATIGGRILVGPTTVLTSDFGSGETTITVKHNQMASGDRIYMEANGSVEFMSVDSAAGGGGPYTYTVTRNLDGSGANNWYAGDAAFNTGAAGDGFIDLYSLTGVLSGAGPTIVGNVRNSATYNDITEHWAIGNLNGVYGYGVDIYGIGLGEYAANEAHMTIDSTDGIRFFTGTATVVGQWTSAGGITVGNAASEHVAISSTAVQIKDGASVYTDLTAGTLTLGLTSTGEYMDLDSTNGIRLYGNNTLNVELTNAGIIRVGENANSKSRLEIGAGVLEIINKSAGGADTTTFEITAAGAATMTAANVRSASSGARVEMFPDANTGIQVIDDAANDVFLALVAGTDVGDVTMGDESSGKYAKYDKSAGTFIVNGSPLSFESIFGDGSDGDVVIAANTTLTEDMFYDDLTINATKVLNTGSFRIHVAGTLTVNGTISRDGVVGGVGGAGGNANGGAGAAGAAGTPGAALADGSVKGAIDGEAGALGAQGVTSTSAGNNGVASGVGTDVAKSLVTNDGAVGGTSGGLDGDNVGSVYDGTPAETQGGDTTAASAVVGTRTGTVFNKANTAFGAWLLYDVFPAGDYLKSAPSGTGGAGGASGAAAKTNPNLAWSGGGGGGGASGGPGGITAIYARTIVVGAAGTIQANGATGGAGGAAGTGDRLQIPTACVAGGSSGGGGGAGGNGGVVLLAYTELTNSGTIEAAGGTGGTGGAGEDGTSINGEGTGAWQWQAGSAGSTGTTGNAGVVIQLVV